LPAWFHYEAHPALTDLLAAEMRARGLAVDIWCFGACDPELRERHHVIDVVPGRRLPTKMPGFANSSLHNVRRVEHGNSTRYRT